MKNFVKNFVSLALALSLTGVVIFLTIYFALRRVEPHKPEIELIADRTKKADHSQFEILKQNFTNPKQVTATCITCHNQRDEQIMKTSHWTWEREHQFNGHKEPAKVGKKHVHNNFCTGALGNNGSCMRCHIGYGWENEDFDFNDPTNVDCLVCHDKTGTYFKQKGYAGWPATAETADEEFKVPDYNYVAQNVGASGRENCGVCHFHGGGGNNVKHGDLEQELVNTTKKIDVHMAADGPNMTCIDCHTTVDHNIMGRAYSVSAENTNRIYCSDCHTNKPHNDKVLDQHINKIACQTCHIPVYAKKNATVMYWDWSVAGRKDENGGKIKEYDADHNYSYLSIKGRFVYDDNVVPEYQWFNGTAHHFLSGDKYSEVPVKINELGGEYADSSSQIWPVKVHRGKQAFDPVTKEILSVKLFAHNQGEGAFWEDLDWEEAIRQGMEYNKREWSGEYEFVSTEVSWPLNHMVSPKEESLKCTQCHTRKDGRLASLTDFYLPGRDYNRWVDYIGFFIVIASLIGVITHAVLRIIR